MPPRQYPGTAPAQATGIHRHDGGRATPKSLCAVWQPGWQRTHPGPYHCSRCLRSLSEGAWKICATVGCYRTLCPADGPDRGARGVCGHNWCGHPPCTGGQNEQPEGVDALD